MSQISSIDLFDLFVDVAAAVGSDDVEDFILLVTCVKLTCKIRKYLSGWEKQIILELYTLIIHYLLRR